MQHLLRLAVLAASATSAHAASASIYNRCSFPVSLWAVDAVRSPTTPQTIPPGGSFTEEYHIPPSGGVSLKLSNTTSCAHPTQFEYTVKDSLTWYDGSNVNCWEVGCPFDAYGIYLETSDPSCRTRTCTPGAPKCDGFYNLFNDDINTLSCDQSKDIMMYLCATSSSPSGGGSTPSNAAPSLAAPSVNAAPAAASSKAAKYQMEAVHGMPTTLKIHARATPEARHVHMRRHMHHPQHKN